MSLPRAGPRPAHPRVLIRPETSDDAAAIDAVTIAAFANAPHGGGTEHFIVRALRAASALSPSLVAMLDARVVGHVAASPVTISDGTNGWFGLGPLSVLPEHQRRGIGSLLMHAVLDALRRRGAAGAVLVGDPAYYARFGFRPEPALVFPGLPADYFQALSFGAPLPAGVVSYHPAFDATS